jgi:hypothetical protein
MEKMIRTTLLALLVAAPLAAAAQNGTPFTVITGNDNGVTGIHGGNGLGGGMGVVTTGTCGVTRLEAFEKFVAGHPTVSEFRAAYSCVQLVLPGDVTTREFRNDNSRYIARVDKFGRIVGGQFQ